ncbi:MAG: hypothetical protein AVDCRST_MAG64-3098, partial [uncultured Phycisphaerae bacterium]
CRRPPRRDGRRDGVADAKRRRPRAARRRRPAGPGPPARGHVRRRARV